MKKRKKFTIIVLLFLIQGFMVSCKEDTMSIYEYKGDEYIGTGKTKTTILSNILDFTKSGKPIYISEVHIKDNEPKLFMVLESLKLNKENKFSYKKDKNGKLVQINDIKNTDSAKWIVKINDEVTDKNINEVSIYEDDSIKFIYDKK